MGKEIFEVRVFANGKTIGIDHIFYEERREVPAPGERFWKKHHRYKTVYRVMPLIKNWQDYELRPPVVWVGVDCYIRPGRRK